MPHGEWLVFATLPPGTARALAAGLETAGIPVVALPADRARVGVGSGRVTELLIPADDEREAVARFGEERGVPVKDAAPAVAGRTG